MGTRGPQPARWPEHLPVGALRLVRWSARYDETVTFYRDIVGLPVLEPSTTATAWTERSSACQAARFILRLCGCLIRGARRLDLISWQRRRQVKVAGHRHVPIDGVQEPQRGIGGVELRHPGVGGVCQHPLRQRGRRPVAGAACPRQRGRSPGPGPRGRSWCRATIRRTTGSRPPRRAPHGRRSAAGRRPPPGAGRCRRPVGSGRRAIQARA